MKITRLVHSSLLIENQSVRVLIDPGDFSFHDDRIDPTTLNDIDYILITHSHDDHCYAPFVQAVLRVSPGATIISNDEVADKLKIDGFSVSTSTPEFLNSELRTHAALWKGAPRPQNTLFTLWDTITVCGDNREIADSKHAPVVAFPITAPWGSMTDAIDRLIEAKPDIVIPVHDWHLSTEGKQWYQQRMAAALEPAGIKLLQIGDTESIDI